MEFDEQSLIARAQEGDLEALAALLRRHQEMALRVACRIVGDRDDAEDVCQESFIKVHDNLATYRARHKFSTWLYRLVVNAALDFLRREKRAEREGLPEDLAVASGAEAVDWRLSVERMLGALTDKQRSAVVLRDLEGFPLAEVAAILGCSGVTARVHLHQGRKRLRQAMESER